MASRAHQGRAQAFPPFAAFAAMLEVIPSLPRPMLARLTARMIDRMDEIDPDPELEDTEGNGPLVDERGTPLPGVEAGFGQDDDCEHEEAAWPTIGAQSEVQSAA